MRHALLSMFVVLAILVCAVAPALADQIDGAIGPTPPIQVEKTWFKWIVSWGINNSPRNDTTWYAEAHPTLPIEASFDFPKLVGGFRTINLVIPESGKSMTFVGPPSVSEPDLFQVKLGGTATATTYRNSAMCPFGPKVQIEWTKQGGKAGARVEVWNRTSADLYWFGEHGLAHTLPTGKSLKDNAANGSYSFFTQEDNPTGSTCMTAWWQQ